MGAYSRTGVNNLDLHVDTGTYYARIKLKGNTIREAVGKDREKAIELAQKWIKKKKGENSRVDGSLGSLVEAYQRWLDEQVTLGEITQSTMDYKLEGLKFLRNTWTDFDLKRISQLVKRDLRSMKVAMMKAYAPTRVNRSITVMREMSALAVEDNMISRADADTLLEDTKYTQVDYDSKRAMGHLPSHANFLTIRDEVIRRCKARGTLGYWLFDFLYKSGTRIESANNVHWEDIDWKGDEIYYRKAKYGPYRTPLFSDLRELLEHLKSVTGGKPGTLVLPSKSIQTVLTAACKHLGLPHISHHDLRHLFATRCLEQGRDFQVVGEWLGHRDNGRTAQLIYGHLRKSHSAEMAKGLKLM